MSPASRNNAARPSLSATGQRSGVSRALATLWPYVQLARVDHWFKNAFMLLGVVLALFYRPAVFDWSNLPTLILGVLATCLIASSNYVLNELIDAPHDRLHPLKKHRPAAAGRVRPVVGVVEWLALGALGIGCAVSINSYFALSGAALWIMGTLYNIPPIRTKEIPYLDVLSESVNNPIRLFLGWFVLIPDRLPPLSLTLAYWMAGAFFMAIKRFAEYRRIGDKARAAAYRKSFRYYNEERLLVSVFFYITACAMFAGIFIVRYHVELILAVPIIAGFFAYYLKLGFREDSPVQNPEQLYREHGFFLYSLLCALVFILLMFTHIPQLYDVFLIEPINVAPLWTIGEP